MCGVPEVKAKEELGFHNSFFQKGEWAPVPHGRLCGFSYHIVRLISYVGSNLGAPGWAPNLQWTKSSQWLHSHRKAELMAQT